MAVTFSVLTFFTGDQALTARVHLLGISSSHHGQIVSTCRHPLAYRTTTGVVFAENNDNEIKDGRGRRGLTESAEQNAN